MSSNPQPCRFGFTCHRADCWFAHPTGRAIDQQQPPAAMPPAAANPYALNPALLPQYMQMLAQPQPGFPSAVGPAAPYASSITKPITSSNLDSSSSHHSHPAASAKRGGGGPAVCRYGRECHREGCYFAHPEGRALDERRGSGTGGRAGGAGGAGRASPSDDEVADALDEFEAANGQLTSEEEDEAAFRRYKQSLGIVDDDEEEEEEEQHVPNGPRGGGRGGVDDTWKDEWFANSRLCDCCKGYVYRCEKQQPTCAQGKCFCSAQLNGAHVQQAAGA
ncbi:hypothetical protein MMC34_008255 [Xylographa carneopallida]|nr:hypothetical protein [Xylographa carneopallida]